MTRTTRLAFVVVALSLVPAAGCGDDDTDAGGATTAPPPTAPPETEPPATEGPCPAGSPNAVPVNPVWQGWIRACGYRDTSVEIVNLSSAVLVATAPRASRLDVTPGTPGDDVTSSAVDILVAEAAPLAGVARRLAPGDALTAWEAGGGHQVYLEVDRSLTVQKYAVDAGVSWAQRKITPGRAFARSVATCATEVSGLWSQELTATGQPPPVEATLIDAILAGRACGSLVREVYAGLNDPPPRPAAFADEMRGVARGLRSSVFDDLLRLAKQFVLAR